MWLSPCVCGAAVFLLAVMEATSAAADADGRARRCVERFEAVIRPLEIESARCWWNANIAGTDENYRKKENAETRLEMALADTKAFAELKSAREGKPKAPLLARQVDVLYLEYLARQTDPELLKAISARSNALEKAFNACRPKVGGKELSDSRIRRILKLTIT